MNFKTWLLGGTSFVGTMYIVSMINIPGIIEMFTSK